MDVAKPIVPHQAAGRNSGVLVAQSAWAPAVQMARTSMAAGMPARPASTPGDLQTVAPKLAVQRTSTSGAGTPPRMQAKPAGDVTATPEVAS